MDADDLFQFSRLSVFRDFFVERRPDEEFGWYVEITTSDPCVSYWASGPKLSGAIEDVIGKVALAERLTRGRL